MKTIKTIVLCALCLLVCAVSSCKAKKTPELTEEQVDNSIESMFFSTEYVIETYFTTDSLAFYVVYDDIDAGFEYESLKVDSISFEIIENACASGKIVKGELVAPNGTYKLIKNLSDGEE